MIKGRVGNLVLLGITAENVARLIADEPIHVKGSDVGVDFDIAIVYGDSIKDIIRELEEAGVQFPDPPAEEVKAKA